VSPGPIQSFPEIDAGNGVVRRVLADSPELMVVEFRFPEGGIGALHNHPHVQSTYVKSGRFAFTVGDETFDLGPGDGSVIPSTVRHGCHALEDDILIDTFTPRRADFL
jgi:quercetin dioxygenase-like cupin family protein